MNLIDSLNTGTTRTANGAVTNPTSKNDCLDFFFLAWAARNMNEQEVIWMFSRALNNDRTIALKILFWARDVRDWAGERRLFRILIQYLASTHEDMFRKILPFVKDYGRWDDLFYSKEILQYTIDYIVDNIKEFKDWLLYKWLPREKSSNKEIALIIRNKLNLSPKAYRHMLAENSITVENQMCDKEWGSIEYKKVPSHAFRIYSSAFMIHDESRFTSFLNRVEEWNETINAWAIYPINLYRDFINGKPVKSINAQWSNLPEYMNDESILPVVDVSGSMTWTPMEAAISLWVYLSERTKWNFKDYFITFSSRPTLQKLSGKVTDRFVQLKRADWGMNTNLQATFKLILDVALRDNLKQSDLPDKVLILSDMEFDSCTNSYSWDNTNIDEDSSNLTFISNMFKASWYEMPKLIFWNLNWRTENIPAQQEEKNVALVSGFSPSIMEAVLWGKDFTPMWVMLTALEKYNFINKL